MSEKSNKKLSLFHITWPIFIEFLLYIMMGTADTIMLSQYSDNSVGAVGISNQIQNFIILLFGIVVTGTTILISQNLGAENKKAAFEIGRTSISLNIVIGIALSLVLFISAPFALKLLNTTPELMSEAKAYLQITSAFLFIQALIMTASGIIRSHGFTRQTMYATLAMNLINVIGNYLFIFGPFGIPVLGVTGVAISTVVSRAIGLSILFIFLIRKVKQPIHFRHLFYFPKEHVKKLLKIGVPAAGEGLFYNTQQLTIVAFIGLLGTMFINTRIYVFNLIFYILLFSLAIGQGTQIIVGRHIGAGENEKAYKQVMRSLKIGMFISLMIAAIFYIVGEPLLSRFTDNAEIISLGLGLLLLTIILEPGRALNLVINNSLRAAGDVKFPVYMGAIFMWGVSVPTAYILGVHFGFGLYGIWIGYILDEWLRGLAMLWRWRSRVWEKMALVKTKKQTET
ncbi:MATE family efflux transporter [Chengkuizengella axinellae]|uniref:MATE family efflux transporter n=1 Tax=Chengkuizengella axinellae TaxID=3064388 RepID=A0ABT9J5X5_9BACL|nr:MATE family efflux transporter [Chengkuizengella sp. 2205SS18-9]MDP5277027.1 MATE family efflux transporter [Chengkuizengella sp. 2205SS18-9]